MTVSRPGAATYQVWGRQNRSIPPLVLRQGRPGIAAPRIAAAQAVRQAAAKTGADPAPRRCYKAGMIEAISAITLATADMARAVAFYRTLGFELLYGGEGANFTSFRAGPGYLNLIAAPGRQAAWWGRAIFYVDDVDALHARAAAAGLRPQAPPRGRRAQRPAVGGIETGIEPPGAEAAEARRAALKRGPQRRRGAERQPCGVAVRRACCRRSNERRRRP